MSGNRCNLLLVVVAELLLTGSPVLGQFDLLVSGNAYHGNIAYGVEVEGGHCFLVGDGGMDVYAVTSPGALTYLTNVHLGYWGLGRDIELAGDHAFIACDQGGLVILDVSDPSSPVQVGQTNNPGYAHDVALAGDMAYLANNYDGLRVYDVSDPTNPVNVGHISHYPTNHDALAAGVAVKGDYAYVGNAIDGLRVYNVSDPSAPVNVAHVSNPPYVFAYGVAVREDVLYVANGLDGLRIYDVSNPASPVNIGHMLHYERIEEASAANASAYRVQLAGNYAVVGFSGDGVRVYDISCPSTAVLVGHAPLTVSEQGTSYGVAIAGNSVHVASYVGGIWVYTLTPRLSIGASGEDCVQVSWLKPPGPDFRLEMTAALAMTNWLAVSNPPVPIGNRSHVILDSCAGEGFFRLAHP